MEKIIVALRVHQPKNPAFTLVTSRLPRGIGVYPVHLPSDSQQLLIQTNKIITSPLPFTSSVLPFHLFNKKITNLFTAR